MFTELTGRARRCAMAVGFLACALSIPALAHHSFAMFDHENRVTVAGTVVKIDKVL